MKPATGSHTFIVSAVCLKSGRRPFSSTKEDERDETRLNRLRDELKKARKRRDEWESKVKDLERRYKEAENTCIHDMVHAANLTPEQLAELIRAASSGLPYSLPASAVVAESDPDDEENYLDEIDDEKEEIEG